jgi:catechol 2,3-dioxygenase-like lactoylglutathione lyase family enzyme
MADDFEVQGIDHVGLTVRDMDRSVHFYRDLVGLELLVDYSMAQDPNRPPGLYHGSHARRRLVIFATGGGPNLALNSHPGDRLEGSPILLDGAGINHVSLTVTDLAALSRRMEAAGVESPGPGWFVDPDGMLVQFEEPGHAAAGLAGLHARVDGG